MRVSHYTQANFRCLCLKFTAINRVFHKVAPAEEVLAQTVFNILNERGLMASPLPAWLGKLYKLVWV